MAYPSNLVRTKDWGNEILTDSDLEGQYDLIIDWVMALANAATGHKHDATANEGPKIIATNLNPTGGSAYQGLRVDAAGTGVEMANMMSDKILRGFEIDTIAVDDASIDVLPGSLLHGITLINKTAATTLTFATAADWWDGAVDSYAGGAGWCYVGVDISGNVKLLGANPPDKDDVAGSTAGTKLYWYDGSLYWRVIGAVRVDTDDQIQFGAYQMGNIVIYDDAVTNTAVLAAGVAVAFTNVDCSVYVPSLSRLCHFVVRGTTGGTAQWRADGSAAAIGSYITDGGADGNMQANIPLNASQVGEYKKTQGTNITFHVHGYIMDTR